MTTSFAIADIVLGDLYMRDEVWSDAANAYRNAFERAQQFNMTGKVMMIYTRLPWLFWHTNEQADAIAVAAHIESISEPDEHELSEEKLNEMNPERLMLWSSDDLK